MNIVDQLCKTNSLNNFKKRAIVLKSKSIRREKSAQRQYTAAAAAKDRIIQLQNENKKRKNQKKRSKMR